MPINSDNETGGPAFPAEGGEDSGLHPHPGMSLRDYFAAAALIGHLSNNSFLFADGNAIAKASFEIADLMLEKRKL